MRVSIETPVFKGKWLRQCVESVLGQSSRDWGLNLVWDGGDDLSRQYLEELQAKNHPQIKIWFSENMGIAKARRFLTSHSEGHYILPLDDDDVLAPRAVERFLAFARARPWCGIVRAKRSFIDETGSPVHEPPWFPFERRHYQHGMVTDVQNHCQPYLIARSAYERTAGWEGFPDFRNAGEDCDIFIKIEEVAPIELLDENLYYYRLNSNRHSLVLTAAGAYEMWRRLADKAIARIGLPLERISEKPPFRYRRVRQTPFSPERVDVIISGVPNADGLKHSERLQRKVLDCGVPPSAIQLLGEERDSLSRRNEALRQTSRPIVLLLDTNMELSGPHLLQELLAVMHRQEADLVGPKIVGPHHMILSAEPFFDARGVPISKGLNEIAAGRYGGLAEVTWLPSRALLLRREVLNAVGTFDEHCPNAHLADADLCLKARFRNFKCVYAGTVAVLDHGPDTGTGDLETKPEFARFADKWSNYPDLLRAGSQLDLVFNV